MNRALQVLDIVELTADNVNRTSDLACLARVSNIFWEPCVRRIWRDMYTLRPLLAFFPLGPLVGAIETDVWHWQILSSADIERCAVHCGFLKSLHFTSTNYGASLHRNELDVLTLQYLSLFRSRLHLFPNLQSLVVTSRSDQTLYWATVLLSSSLESLDINLQGIHRGQRVPVSTCLPSFLQRLPDRAPKLKSLTLHGAEFDPHEVQVHVVDALTHLHHLTAFHAHFHLTHPDISPTLAEVKQLERASLNLTTRAVFGNRPFLPLKNLRSLCLFGYVKHCFELLERVPLPLVQRLEFHLLDIDVDGSLLLSISQASASLHELEIHLPYLKRPEHAAIQPAECNPIYTCKSLLRLCIISEHLEEEEEDDPNHVFMLWSDADILQLAQNLSRLRYLNLRAGRKRTTQPIMTPYGFLHLATHCRSLETLIVAVNMEGFLALEDLPPPSLYLTNLTLERFSIIDAAELVSECIIALWPNAQLYMDRLGVQYDDVRTFCEEFNARRLAI